MHPCFKNAMFCLLLAWSPFPAQAVLLYSVDVSQDQLVTIDTDTGYTQAVAAIGSAGNMVDVDLALLDGVLYCLSFNDANATSLTAIDVPSGAILQTNAVLLNGQTAVESEGLAAVDGQLLASFRYQATFTSSNALGTLQPDGYLSFLHDYRDLDPTADGDGLAALPSGHLLWHDVTPNVNSRFIDVGLPPTPTYNILGIPSPYAYINDIVVLGTHAWGIDHYEHLLTHIDVSTGHILSSIPYSPDLTLFGLEIAMGPAQQADLAIVKTGPSGPVRLGDEFAYSLTVVNHGPNAAPYVTVRDVLPAGVRFQSALASQGVCFEQNHVVTCYLGALANGGSATVDIAVQLDSLLLRNAATASSDVFDGNSANDIGEAVTHIDECVSGVSEPPGQTTAVALERARPNPLKAGTVISFTLPRPEAITVAVYDVAGRRVALLFDGIADGGRHTLAWDGRDVHGRPAAAGTYIMSLMTAGGVKSEKVCVLR